MPRGKAEFETMDLIKTKPGEGCVPAKGDDQVHVNERAPKLPGDPMRNILGKGLVADDITQRGFAQDIIDEAVASIKK